MKSYKIYGKVSCGYCTRLVQAMIDQKKTFFAHFLDDDLETLQEKKNLYGHQTVPIVILRQGEKETLIGGCTETLRILKKEL